MKRRPYWLLEPSMYHFRRNIAAVMESNCLHRKRMRIAKAQIRAAKAYFGYYDRTFFRLGL